MRLLALKSVFETIRNATLIYAAGRGAPACGAVDWAPPAEVLGRRGARGAGSRKITNKTTCKITSKTTGEITTKITAEITCT